jgi:two-component system cell cycle sensor histidine kinase/response regulator CckA
MTPRSSGGERILVVDDADAVRQLVRNFLLGDGYTVLEADNGHAALEVLTRTGATVDLVLTDIMMPQMGGPELASRVAELLPDLPVIFMSGYTDQPVPLRNGVPAPFLSKPFTASVLLESVRLALGRNETDSDGALT